MKIRSLRIFPTLLLLFLAVSALSACGGHEHTVSGWIMQPKATCTSIGHRIKKCLSCNEILEEEDYNTSHSYEEGFCIYCKRPQRDESHLKYAAVTIDGKEGYAVTGIGSSNAVDMVIPEKHNSLPVLAIAENAFVQCVNLVSVTVPKTVVAIGDRAFYACTALTTVTFASGSACTEIGVFAFAECESLRTATIPAGVTTLSDSLFSGCVELKTLNLYGNITAVGADAFGNCKKLTTREENGAIYLGSKANPYMILYGVADRTVSALTVNESTLVIGPAALAGCSGLTALTLPESVVSISPYAFSGCASLSLLTLPSALRSLGAYALQDCRALTALTLPSGLAEIGTGAFYGCTALATLTLPESLTSVGAAAFYGCSALQFNAHGHGRYLGTAANPYFLLCGFDDIAAADTPHPDNRLVAADADKTPIA